VEMTVLTCRLARRAAQSKMGRAARENYTLIG
jgi:hypothetical protein